VPHVPREPVPSVRARHPEAYGRTHTTSVRVHASATSAASAADSSGTDGSGGGGAGRRSKKLAIDSSALTPRACHSASRRGRDGVAQLTPGTGEPPGGGR
jgi:hypothetical protein